MLEYTLEDARKLLSQNLETANTNLVGIQRDLDFLRDQVTTTEVSMARVHNYKVTNKAKATKASA